jgi:5'-nucleotidase
VRILLTNDDGINASGLRAAAEVLSHICKVIVVAPDREQSGKGTSISLSSPLRISKVKRIAAGVPSYAVEGTPADSVILGLDQMAKDVDLVVSGINSGANLGEDIFISGTVGAALQGYFRGLPSIAISVGSLHPPTFHAATVILAAIVRQIEKEGYSNRLLLNVNVPSIQFSDICGIDVTRLGGRAYTDVITTGDDGKQEYYWIAHGTPAWHLVEGTDIWAVRNNRISITPLHSDLTDGKRLGEINKFTDKLRGSFDAS